MTLTNSMYVTKYRAVIKLRSVAIGLSLLSTLSLTIPFAHADCVYQSPPAEDYGPVIDSLKTMSINTYGQDVEGVGDFLTSTDGPCQDRLREIGEHIRDAREPYDIVGLQEWHTDTATTCNGVVLKNRIDDIYPVSGVNVGERTMDHYQWAHPKAHGQNDGGLGVISRTKFFWDPYREGDFATVVNTGGGVPSIVSNPTETENVHQFTPRLNSNFGRTAHGFLFARIFLSQNPVIAVDTYVVHLTSTGSGGNRCNLQCKRGMLEQLREGIHQRSADSGFPVLVMGDFNIGGPFDDVDPTEPCAGPAGYRDILINLGNPKDLWLEGVGAPLNRDEGYTYLSTDPSKTKRIDYMFVPSDPYLVNSPYTITHKSPRNIAHVQLSNSDHRAVFAELDIHKKNNTELRNGHVTIQQKSTERYLDAHETADNDFELVTRPKQSNSTQKWRITSLGNDTFTLKQVSSRRFVDAHENEGRNFAVVSRLAQNNDTQRWIIKPLGNNLFTVKQKSTNRYLDAHVTGAEDFQVVTRSAQYNNTQRWIIKPVPFEQNFIETTGTTSER